MKSVLKKLTAGTLVALTMAGGVIVSTGPAAAYCGYGHPCGGHYYYHGHGGWGAPLAAGILGGLAVGAIAGAATAPYYGPAPGYYGPPGGCYYVRTPVYDQWGNFAGYRPVQRCD